MGTAFAIANAAVTTAGALFSHPQASPAQVAPVDYSNLWKGLDDYIAPQVNSPMPDLSSFYTAQNIQAQDTSIQALAQEAQGNTQMNEAGLAAQQKATEVNQYLGDTAQAYQSSGVTLAGSPLQVLAQARALGQQAIGAIQSQGLAQANLAYQQAQITRNQGRAQLLGQTSQLDSSLASFYTNQAKQNINQITAEHGQNLANLQTLYSNRYTASPYKNEFGNNNGAANIGQALNSVFQNSGLKNPFSSSAVTGSSGISSGYQSGTYNVEPELAPDMIAEL